MESEEKEEMKREGRRVRGKRRKEGRTGDLCRCIVGK